jgi:hypothetical protein
MTVQIIISSFSPTLSASGVDFMQTLKNKKNAHKINSLYRSNSFKMNYLIKKLVVTAALFALLDPSTQASAQGVRGGDQPRLGAPRGDGPPEGAGRGKGIGRGVGRPGDFFGRNETLFLNLTCIEEPAQAYSCDLPRGDEEGMFVCRTREHPGTGENNQFPMCIAPDRAIEGDECGCCGDDENACPKPCGCTCELGEGRDGAVREGAYVLFDDADEPVCVPTRVSMRLVARSTEDRAATCLEECPL